MTISHNLHCAWSTVRHTKYNCIITQRCRCGQT